MDEDIEELQMTLRTDPYNFQARKEFAVELLDAGFTVEATKNLEYLVNTFPDNAEIYYNLGIAYEKLKEFEKAEETYIKAIELSPDVDYFYNLGITFMEEKKYEEAIPVFQKVLEVEDDTNTFFNLGVSYFKTERYDLSLENFQKAIELNKDDFYAHFYMGNILKHEGLNDFARDEFNKVLQLAPNYSWAFYNLGSIAYEIGDTENAIFYLKNTIQANPKDIKAYEILVKLYMKQERYMEADEMLMNALNVVGANGDLYYIYSQIFKRRDDREKYINSLKLAVQNSDTLTYSLPYITEELRQANLNKTDKEEE